MCVLVIFERENCKSQIQALCAPEDFCWHLTVKMWYCAQTKSYWKLFFLDINLKFGKQLVYICGLNLFLCSRLVKTFHNRAINLVYLHPWALPQLYKCFFFYKISCCFYYMIYDVCIIWTCHFACWVVHREWNCPIFSTGQGIHYKLTDCYPKTVLD